MSQPLASPEVLVSNLSLPPRVLASGGTEAHERYLRGVGASGIELTPIHPVFYPFMRTILRNAVYEHPDGNIPDEYAVVREIVQAGHSSFREVDKDKSVIAPLFPRWPDSLRVLTQVKRMRPDHFPVVLYPNFENGQVVYDDSNAPFDERTFQPKAADFKNWGLEDGSRTPVPVIQHASEAHGLRKVTVDCLHVQLGFEDPLDMAVRLAAAGLVSEFHVSLNRLDITGRHSELAERTRQAKRAFEQSAEAAGATLEGEMLKVVADQWRNNPQYAGRLGRVVLEDGPVKKPGYKGTMRSHRSIIETIKELIS